MNQAMKAIIPKHIDPRETVKKAPTAEVLNMTFMMKDSGTTPYRYVRRALKCLASGDYGIACDWLDYADNFAGVFWPVDSSDNEAFKLNIDTLRLQFIFLTERFKELRPEEDRESVK